MVNIAEYDVSEDSVSDISYRHNRQEEAKSQQPENEHQQASSLSFSPDPSYLGKKQIGD